MQVWNVVRGSISRDTMECFDGMIEVSKVRWTRMSAVESLACLVTHRSVSAIKASFNTNFRGDALAGSRPYVQA